MSSYRIWVYSVALFVLTGTILFMQVSWLLESARLEESFLNQRINTALCGALEVMSKDKGICSTFASCKVHSPGTFEFKLSSREKQKVDSIIYRHLLQFNIDVPFQSTFTPYLGAKADRLSANQALLYPASTAGIDNILVELEIPSQADYVRAQINGTFILSLVVLGLLIWLFLSTLRSLNKERGIRNDTIDFVNTMAHDLKTPISNISIATSMLMKEGHENQYISIIDSEIGKLKHRARQILGMTSVDAMLDEKANLTRVDLHEIIRQSMESVSLELQKTKGKFELKLEATRHVVEGNLIQLSSAFTNIVDNALIYSKPAPMIRVKTVDEDGTIRIEIEDNGPGIPASEQLLIFNKGYRIHNGQSKVEGYGLGLYLAKTFIEKQKGSLNLVSDGATGSRFVIQLPSGDFIKN